MRWLRTLLSRFNQQANTGRASIAYTYAVGSHAGLVRELNEDSFLALPDHGLWIVADGMGGHEAGEVASQIAVREIASSIVAGMSLVDAILSAHNVIQNTAGNGTGVGNMGTTVVAVKFKNLNYEIAWVGDSRAYLWNSTLHQLTSDHSYVQLLLDSGVITESEVAAHPRRNMITQALGLACGGSDALKIDCIAGKLEKNETLLLCSDGLHGEVSDKAIAFILAQKTSNTVRADCLVKAAIDSGGRDNVTVILVTPAL